MWNQNLEILLSWVERPYKGWPMALFMPQSIELVLQVLNNEIVKLTYLGIWILTFLLGDKERHSLAFFYDPNPEAILEPIEKFQVGGKKLYGAKLAGHKGIRRNL